MNPYESPEEIVRAELVPQGPQRHPLETIWQITCLIIVIALLYVALLPWL